MADRRILVLATTFPRWARDREPPFVFELCRRLDGFEVHVIAPHAEGAALEETLDGVHVHRFRYAPARWERLAYQGGITANLKKYRLNYLLLPLFLLSMLLRAHRVARAHDIHLIHAHWIIPLGLIGALLKRLLPGDNRLLITAHGGDVYALRGGLFARLRRLASRHADRITVVSQAMRQTAVRENWHRHEAIEVIPMGTDLRHLFVPRPRPPGPPGVIFAGRLVEKKGVQHLLAALPLVLRQIPECHLTIAGDGPLLPALKQLAQQLGLSDRVNFHGAYQQQELPDILARSDIAVLPFDRGEDGDMEGLGLTIIEAMGCGIPVIAGDVPAVHDIITDQQTGLLVDARRPEQLAEKIVTLLKDPDMAQEMAARARQHALRMVDWDVVASRYRQALETFRKLRKVF